MSTPPHTPLDSDIAIVGMACRFPQADTIEAFWYNILHQIDATLRFSELDLKREGILENEFKKKNYVNAKPSLEDADCFDARFFGFSAREAKYLDPQIRLFLEISYHALQHAGYSHQRHSGKVGVFAGASTSLGWIRHTLQAPKALTIAEEFESWILSCKDFLSQIVSYRLDLTGPSYTLYTACSTSLAAVHLACQSLRSNESILALAGGVTIDLPLRGGYIYEPGMIHSPTGKCRPFDDEADGTIFGDGAGVIVLKKLEKALEDHDRIYAVIKGSCCNNDGHRKSGFLAPSAEGQKEVVQGAYSIAHTSAGSIDYLETHGTATKIGDPVELEGLLSVYSAQSTSAHTCALGSVKGNIGHLHAAAGIAALIKVVLALQHKIIPPLTNFETLNPDIPTSAPFFFFPKNALHWEENESHSRQAAISSFGVGGTNVHLVVEEPPPPRVQEFHPVGPPYVFPLSAKTPGALERTIALFFEYVERNPNVDLSSLAYTLQVGRDPFAYRRTLTADCYPSLLRAKNQLGQHTYGSQRPLILICGSLSEIDPVLFKERSTNPCLQESHRAWNSLLKKCLPQHLTDGILYLLSNPYADPLLFHPIANKIALFLHQLIQTQYLLSIGLQPTAIFGEKEGAHIAAICSQPGRFESYFLTYLSGLSMEHLPQTKICTKEVLHSYLWPPDHISSLKDSAFLLCGTSSSCHSTLLTSQIHTSADLQSAPLKRLFAHLWQSGVCIEWHKMYQNCKLQTLPLPQYPFEREKHLPGNEKNRVGCCPLPGSSETLPSSSTEKISTQVSVLLEEILNLPAAGATDNLFSLGADSLQLVQLISRINATFNVHLDLNKIYQTPYLSALVELIAESQNKG